VLAPVFIIHGLRTCRVVGQVIDLPLHDDGEGGSQGRAYQAGQSSTENDYARHAAGVQTSDWRFLLRNRSRMFWAWLDSRSKSV